MSLQADCPSCLTGIHDGHDPEWGIRAGLIGGNYCGCTGDCAERAKAAFDSAWGAVLGDHDHAQCCAYLCCAHPKCCGYLGERRISPETHPTPTTTETGTTNGAADE